MADMHTPLARQIAADTFDCTHGGRMAVSQRMRDGLADDHDMVQCAVAATDARASQDAETIKALEAQIATKDAALEAARKFIEVEYSDPSAELDGEWLAPESRKTHARICAALAGSAS